MPRPPRPSTDFTPVLLRSRPGRRRRRRYAGPGARAGDLPPGDRPPPTAFSRLADAGDADAHPGADLVVVFEETVNRVNALGRHRGRRLPPDQGADRRPAAATTPC